jgi:hypothetical protein
MSTTTAKKQAATTKTQVKRTASTAKSTAKATTQRTATQARRASESAQRTVKTVVTDAGYATVGLTDTAIAYVRTLPTKLSSVPTEAPRLVEETPRLVEQRLETLRTNAEREFNVLAERGRNIVTELSKKNSAGQRAADQARNARIQLKAATTSLRNAGRQAEREQYEAMTVAELQDLARRKGIENRSEKNKQQLITALLSA